LDSGKGIIAEFRELLLTAHDERFEVRCASGGRITRISRIRQNIAQGDGPFDQQNGPT
jgi:hypothetical protein